MVTIKHLIGNNKISFPFEKTNATTETSEFKATTTGFTGSVINLFMSVVLCFVELPDL